MKCEACSKKIDPTEFYSDWIYCKFCKKPFDNQPERSKREDSYRVEFGSSSPISCMTSEGIKTMIPGKIYN